MYQVHFPRGSEAEFRSFVESVAKKAGDDTSVLFHLLNDTAKRDVTDRAAAIVREVIPHAAFVGCSTSGNICDGAFVDGEFPNLSAACTVFEDPTTKLEVHQLPFTRDNREQVAKQFIQLVEERPWVKAVEFITTLIDVGMADFCVDIGGVREDVVMFGGGALTSESFDMWAGLPYVFSSEGEANGHSIVFVLYGGASFRVCTQTVYGWKPLGRPMRITKANGPVLYELDDAPAFDWYHHYLKLEYDEEFTGNSIIFPLAIQHEGNMVIKAPVKVDDEGAITLTSDLAPYHEQCRIAYGDPGTILRSIRETANVMRVFAPQSVLAFSCAARHMYWGVEHVSRETLPFESVAPTFGFYTGGEFSRRSGRLLHHNVTLVVAGMREGDVEDGAVADEIDIDVTDFTRQMAIVNRLAALVGTTSAELEEAYERMKHMAKTDGLTGVCNRREIESRIIEAISESGGGVSGATPSIIMLDLDDFKAVNDVYGHEAGDEVLRQLGKLLHRMIDETDIGSSGRWGGEEFMIVLPAMSVKSAFEVARRLSDAFNSTNFPMTGHHTASFGVAQALPGETSDSLCQRVDTALYDAKGRGKNCIVEA